eukprot:CAMPEP_0206609184 /NCGR_PEP_ID=MMETSP0325_2-20121206/53585_1 /ASSEMBLY_ACC=CAM_ASM_000347 /TAXON_ID=2866 /ORGANISM="Crypthecodinium cohnii, Strain Seligo" /LENGTH=32 /DNA_ID= /DNA_START= /DNA_END= /DNA_ORIENTATION=
MIAMLFQRRPHTSSWMNAATAWPNGMHEALSM